MFSSDLRIMWIFLPRGYTICDMHTIVIVGHVMAEILVAEATGVEG